MRLRLSLFLNYFVFAILLNSVGTVILQVQKHYGVSASGASILEACKDLSIAVASCLAASFLFRYGYKRAMLLALGGMTVVLAAIPSFGGFWAMKLLFVATGVAFALIKVSVFASISLVAPEPKAHASFMSFLESCFMVGVLSGYFLFSAFAADDAAAPEAWLRVYYVLALMTLVAFGLLWGAPLPEPAAPAVPGESWLAQVRGTARLGVQPVVLAFGSCVFLYVLIEQAIMSWLPTFNNQVLHLPARLSIEMASILAASTALGRFAAGWLLRKLPWFAVLAGCLAAAAALVLVALPLAGAATAGTVTGWGNAPLAAWIFPSIGLCLAPIYPTVNSLILSALPPDRHAPMAGLIVIFSALGGTTGSMITGRVFETYGGQTAFYFSLVPLVLLGLCLAGFRQLRGRAAATSASHAS